MKISLKKIAIIASAVLFAGCMNGEAVQGSGTLKTEERAISAFNEVNVHGNEPFLIFCGQRATVKVMRAKKPSVAISADENLLPLIKIASQNNQVTIDLPKQVRTKNGIKLELRTPPVRVYNSATKEHTESFSSSADGCIDISWNMDELP